MYDPGKLRRNEKGKHPPSFAERLRRKMLVVALFCGGTGRGAVLARQPPEPRQGASEEARQQANNKEKLDGLGSPSYESAPHHKPSPPAPLPKGEGVWRRWKTW